MKAIILIITLILYGDIDTAIIYTDKCCKFLKERQAQRFPPPPPPPKLRKHNTSAEKETVDNKYT